MLSSAQTVPLAPSIFAPPIVSTSLIGGTLGALAGAAWTARSEKAARVSVTVSSPLFPSYSQLPQVASLSNSLPPHINWKSVYSSSARTGLKSAGTIALFLSTDQSLREYFGVRIANKAFAGLTCGAIVGAISGRSGRAALYSALYFSACGLCLGFLEKSLIILHRFNDASGTSSLSPPNELSGLQALQQPQQQPSHDTASADAVPSVDASPHANSNQGNKT